MKLSYSISIVSAIWLGIASVQVANAMGHDKVGGAGHEMMGPGLMMPSMNPAEGRELFASKGCVVCHSINGVGGEDAPPLDASTMELPMNPFEFAARMWRGAEAMVLLQREELGEPISLTGQELAAIIAFVHDGAEQKRFSESDIPPRIESLLHHMGGEEHHGDAEGHNGDADGHKTN